jgi:phosphatidylethanolamine-binding protein (PEBP) family uncharacterized protein
LGVVVPAAAVDGGIEVSSSDMTDGEPLNPLFACSAVGTPDGLISPRLSWSGNSDAETCVALMHDEFGADAEFDGAAGDWAHWVTYNIDAATTLLPRDASATGTLVGGTEGVNTWGAFGEPGEDRYRGPCPQTPPRTTTTSPSTLWTPPSHPQAPDPAEQLPPTTCWLRWTDTSSTKATCKSPSPTPRSAPTAPTSSSQPTLPTSKPTAEPARPAQIASTCIQRRPRVATPLSHPGSFAPGRPAPGCPCHSLTPKG